MVPPNSRAILVGVSRYDDSESFPELLAAANSVRAMRTLLTDPDLCGWLPEEVTTVPNPASRAEVEQLMSDAAERTTGVLLIYYVGRAIELVSGEHYVVFTDSSDPLPDEEAIEELRIIAYSLRNKGTLGTGPVQVTQTLTEAVATGVFTNDGFGRFPGLS